LLEARLRRNRVVVVGFGTVRPRNKVQVMERRRWDRARNRANVEGRDSVAVAVVVVVAVAATFAAVVVDTEVGGQGQHRHGRGGRHRLKRGVVDISESPSKGYRRRGRFRCARSWKVQEAGEDTRNSGQETAHRERSTIGEVFAVRRDEERSPRI